MKPTYAGGIAVRSGGIAHSWRHFVPSQAQVTCIFHGGVKFAWNTFRVLGGEGREVSGVGAVKSAYAGFTPEYIWCGKYFSRVTLGILPSFLQFIPLHCFPIAFKRRVM